MKPNHQEWPELLRLLDTALQLPEPEHGPWLAALPAHQQSAVRELLASRRALETADFLVKPAALPGLATDDSAALSGAAHSGQRVGPWRLLHQIGSGGMAWVWLAERADGQGKRRVALKLPRLGWAPGLAERMARERDILATLEHPYIARLYDAGVDEQGRPWLALEPVQGQAIDVHAREHALSISQRLALLLQVCEAVAHAHAQQVLHRDIKPSNILVTADAQVRLLDFGIAKLMHGEQADASHLTQASGRALTPHYASPEQVLGQSLAATSDVYSLGVVAYELLAGTRPYRLRRGTAAEVEEAITQAHISAPSRRAASAAERRALRGDVDAVLLKALQRAPADRYQQVSDLAADIHHLLRHQPVSARPDAWWHRTSLLVQRHPLESGLLLAMVVAIPAGAAAQVAVMLALGAGAAATLWQARKAQAQLREADLQRQRAEQVKQLTLSFFQAADSDEGANADTRAADLLHSAAARLAAESTLDATVAAELQLGLAESFISLGLPDAALPLAQAALRIAQGSAQARPRLQAPLLLDALLAVGEALNTGGQPERALAVLERGLALPADPRRAVKLRVRLFSALHNMGQQVQGVPLAREAAALAESHLQDVGLRQAMHAHGVLAFALKSTNAPGMLAAAMRAQSLAQQLYGSARTRPVLFYSADVALAHVNEGDALAGVAELRRLMPEIERLLGPQHPQFAVRLNYLCIAESDIGDVHAALATMRRGLALAEASEGPASPTAITARSVIGSNLLKAQYAAEALTTLSEAARINLQAGADTLPRGHATQVSLAHALALAGELNAAQAVFDAVAPDSPVWALGSVQVYRADLLARQGLLAPALALLHQAVPLLTPLPPLRSAAAMTLAAATALRCHEPALALQWAQQTLQQVHGKQIDASPVVAELQRLVGLCQYRLGNLQAGQAALADALRRWRLFDAQHVRVQEISALCDSQAQRSCPASDAASDAAKDAANKAAPHPP